MITNRPRDAGSPSRLGQSGSLFFPCRSKTERTVLEGVEVLDAELAGDVRAQTLTFKNIVRLERGDIQRLLRGVSPAILGIALKGAPGVVLETVRNNISDQYL